MLKSRYIPMIIYVFGLVSRWVTIFFFPPCLDGRPEEGLVKLRPKPLRAAVATPHPAAPGDLADGGDGQKHPRADQGVGCGLIFSGKQTETSPWLTRYPLVMSNIAIEILWFIVDFPMKHGDFPIVM